MLIFFQVCFGVGLGYSAISFIAGQLLSGLSGGQAEADLSADAAFDAVDAGIEAADGNGAASVSPFKPTVIAAFLAVFGGAGMILMPRMGVYLAVTIAGAAGLIGAYVIFRYVYMFLFNSQNTSTVARQSLVGSMAKVTESIPQGQYGKITYRVKGGTYTAPAKSEDGGGIARGAEVEIVSIIKNTYFVKNKP